MSAIRPIRQFAMAALLATAAGCATDISNVPSSDAPSNVATGDAKGDAKSDVKGNAANGRELFMSNACATCHGVTKENNMTVGPNLVGILGRKAGTGKSLLGASENLKKYGVIWSPETLDEFLANPDGKVPGTAMIGMVSDPQQRADLIAYLSTLKE